ncbi:putative transposase [Kitasatospora setae KM-6054]|uniref:Putative transposase n=1 Tax=Kitasatospora setae (strain ATCC 33774 / DSM 43861 / JCM 3304 / KCC A-0304 / NBRC 14216 / KM-6054) TaxID=452652 RepID=E4NEG5_KITSK|nr:putative transposase [Kitasatospora setae KM-6054]
MEEVRGGPAGPFEDLEVIRAEAGMPTARFCRLIGVPERTWRRHQARARQGAPTRGPWPRPAREGARAAAHWHALAHPARGHRKVWAMCRHDGHRVSQVTVLRLLRDEGPAPGSELPAGAAPARRPPQGRLRHRADRPEPGPAARLLRVRDDRRRHLAARGLPRLLVEVRARLARVAHREPARRRRCD